MEHDNTNLEEQIKKYERVYGELTNLYPWNFQSSYLGHTSGKILDEWLKLNQDGTFECNFSIGAVNEYLWFLWVAKGTFCYDSKERKLTLQSNEIKFQEYSNWNKDLLNSVIEECVNKTFKKLEIPHFFWGSIKINLPWYHIIKDNSGKYDFYNPVLSYFELKPFYGNLELCAKLEVIEITNNHLNDEEPINKIIKPLVFGSLTLYPDNTLKVCDINSSWDSNGPYNWDSSFECKGTWQYSSKNEMKLSFHSFEINNDGSKIGVDQVEIMNLPTEAITQNFFLESSYIRCIKPKWNMSEFEEAKIELIQK